MQNFRWSTRSLKALQGVHPDLRRVADRALLLSPIDFMVTEGGRSIDRQKELLRIGATRTMNSKHLLVPARAIDIAAWVDGSIRWDWPLYAKIASAFKQAAADLNVPITWGGDWRTFKDGPHFEMR